MALMLTAPLMGFEDKVRPILKNSCLKCHGGEKVKGKVDFSKILTERDAGAHLDLWSTVIEMVESGSKTGVQYYVTMRV